MSEPTALNISALTAVINPVTAGSSTKRVFVWANSPTNGTLSFQQRPLYNGGKQEFIGHQGKSQTPEIANPSTLAAIIRDDMVEVYGVILKTDTKASPSTTDTKETMVVSMLSPVVNTIYEPGTGEPKLNSGRTSACANNKSNSGWLYFQCEKEQKFPLYRVGLSETDGGRSEVRTLRDPISHTGIASFYAAKQRFIVYQTAKEGIRLRNDTMDQEYQVLSSQGFAKTPTPLEVTFIPGDAPRVIIYFLDTKSILYRGSFITNADLTSVKAEPLSKVSNDAIQVQDLTQLSAVPDEAGKQNVIYFLREEEKNLSIVIDPWVEDK